MGICHSEVDNRRNSVGATPYGQRPHLNVFNQDRFSSVEKYLGMVSRNRTKQGDKGSQKNGVQRAVAGSEGGFTAAVPSPTIVSGKLQPQQDRQQKGHNRKRSSIDEKKVWASLSDAMTIRMQIQGAKE
mmetsp:Transcript_16658/g.31591  ORF Transcript_16658/g.31591 Transcript_16658/m.31591 type:complete len:129 (-) Transcript_16658:411-797(-)|eukprot:CAMPEP_0170196742 /NCGR_PEP_ID=MMETSP0040_2-20121228/64658_1 /TAXON_ID=641309 /ORGANISM="Lotharella oceanica, Strain CCMP622" /LENGTH=128 /DNA_ID=CAMNT_0010446257 /DNA_START=61 /DNA_END=447 /DNA_ORIENTATION=+